MIESHDTTPPPLPASLRAKLTEYRRALWRTKSMEAVFAALFGLLLSFLLVFALDRFIETPAWARLALLVAGLVGGVVFLPLQVTRWIGAHLSLKSVARRVAREDIAAGDVLLGVMALTSDREEFGRSPELALAAIAQGEQALVGRDLSHTLPRSRHRGWGAVALLALVAAAASFAVVPGAAKNALTRWLRPTAGIERFTFARLAPHPDHLVVARFEPFQLTLELAEDTRREPELASLSLRGGESLSATRMGGRYVFELPALGATTSGHLIVGDFREELRLEPVDRPEIRAARATIELPAYMELPEPRSSDVRGGAVGVVEGSAVAVTAELTRELVSATWSAGQAEVEGAVLQTDFALVHESADSELAWRDVHGLTGTVPFQLGLRARPDAKPTVLTEGLMSDTILLHDKAVSFRVRSNDDFGVRQVGLEWEGSGEIERGYEHAKGEKLLGLGEPDARELELVATLHPRLQGIDPQVLTVRAFALDALPGRERSYSAPVRVQIMTEDDHMIWVTRSLAGWFDEAVEVRDQENSLLKVNEELFGMTNAQLATPEVQRKLQSQSAAERVNSRRLNRLVGSGNRLLAEATRNEQINSNTLDDWAEMMAALQAIADERMPSVAELLAKAASAEEARSQPASAAGVNRETPAPTPPAASAKVELPSAPQVADIESSFNDPAEPSGAGGESKPPPANLSLAQTTVSGGGAKGQPAPPEADDTAAEEEPGPTKEELAKAIAEQRALMEEFQKVAGKITEILSNLEGSTFVKRLKALSRAETGVAQDLDTTLASAFGAKEVPESSAEVIAGVSAAQESAAQRASLVRVDLAAYVERMSGQGQDTGKFETVHKEMGEVGVTREMAAINGLAEISRAGEAIAGAENLADELDRWAEILVGPG